MVNFQRNMLRATLLSVGTAGAFLNAHADIVWVSKDCSLPNTPCTVQGSSSDPQKLGRFTLTGSSFNWSATYTGSPTEAKRFWVSQGGANMATNELSTSSGDLGGTASLSTGVWYISIRTFLMGSGSYSVSGATVLGDPHITTTNGIHYDFQGAGEFVLLRDGSGFEVQSRMTPVASGTPLPPDPHTGLSSCVSLNTAAAIRVGDQRITYEPNLSGQPDPAGLQLRVDGKSVAVGAGGKTLINGTRVVRDARTGELRVEFRDESLVRVIPHWWPDRSLWYLDFDFTPPDRSTGIVGPIASDGWLPALADGTSIGPQPAPLPDRYKALYVKFADSWRVSDTTSLFDYAPGTSTTTYTMKAWPPEDGKCALPFAVPVQGVSEDIAERVCQGAIIPTLKQSCVQDVMLTGNRNMGKGYLVTQGTSKFKVKVPAGRPTKNKGD